MEERRQAPLRHTVSTFNGILTCNVCARGMCICANVSLWKIQCILARCDRKVEVEFDMEDCEGQG